MENKNINEVEVIEEVEEIEVENESKGIGHKIVGGLKKHGKKIAIGVAATAGLAVAYCLGAKSAGKGDDESEADDGDVLEIEFDVVDDAE